jgi:GTP pyrophosphokinase
MYQSLHTTVMDGVGRTVDIQIRTLSMHRLAETGIIARPVGPGADGARLEGLAWLHSLLDWQVDTKDPGEFLESLSADLDSDEVVTFTPKGKMIALPARSSPVDVAYAVHTDVGHRAIGARVNGRLAPLHTRLRNGDVVEILTSGLPNAAPSEDWLEFVKTARARVRIRRRLARQRRDSTQPTAIRPPAAEARPKPPAAAPPAPAEPGIGVTSESAVSSEPAGARRRRFTGRPDTRGAEPSGAPRRPSRRGAPAAGLAAVDGRGDVPVRRARCCLPLPGDAVVGFASTHYSAVSLHRRECANAAGSPPDREQVAVTSWSAPELRTFPAEIIVEAFDRYGLLADITEALSETTAAVRAASTSTSDDRVAHARFTVEVTGPEQLARVLVAVRGVGGVYDCYRACQTTV